MKEYQIIITETESGRLQVKAPSVLINQNSNISELVLAYLKQVIESIREDEKEDPNGIKNRIYQQLILNVLT